MTTTLTLNQVLNPTPRTVTADTTLSEVWHIMQALPGHCVVVLAGQAPVGSFGERECMDLLARGGWKGGEPIGRYMREPLIARNPAMDLYSAYQFMVARNARQLLLVDAAGDLLGLVGEDDLLHALCQVSAGAIPVQEDGRGYPGGSVVEKLRLAAMVLDNTQEGILVTDAESRILFVNRAFTRITGYEEEEVVGKTPQLLKSGRHDALFYEELWREITVNGNWQGEIWNRNKEGMEYPQWLSISGILDEGGRVVNYVGAFADISQLKHSEAQLEHLAHHDPLTTLPNRTLFQSRLAHAIDVARRRGTRLGLLFMDLDGFKHINDSLGHPVGDELLQAIAGRLCANLRTADTLARQGGDEFVVLVEELGTPNEAAVVAQTLLALLRQPFHLSGGQEVFSGACIGISLYPDDAEDATQLLRNADAALYLAKSQGRDTYRFYTESLTLLANERVQMEASLRGALERGEFVLHYQPQVDTSDGRLVGAEALLRWLTPAGKLLHPASFIALAEETGLIRPMGEWVLREACTQFRAWFDAGLKPLPLAVNLSTRQFEQPDLVERIGAILEETGFPATLLELEITEATLLAQRDRALAQIAALKKLGVRIVIDDFGTGFSSLTIIQRCAIDKLKIDRSFIHDLPRDNLAIAAAVIAMAKHLKLAIFGVGVESEEQLAFLQIQDCDAWQGYHFSPPLAAEPFLELWRHSVSDFPTTPT